MKSFSLNYSLHRYVLKSTFLRSKLRFIKPVKRQTNNKPILAQSQCLSAYKSNLKVNSRTEGGNSFFALHFHTSILKVNTFEQHWRLLPAHPIYALNWTFTSISPNRWRVVNNIVRVKKELAYGNGQAFTNKQCHKVNKTNNMASFFKSHLLSQTALCE